MDYENYEMPLYNTVADENYQIPQDITNATVKN